MATAASSATAVLAAPDPAPDIPPAGLTTETDPNATPNGSVSVPTDPTVHPGLRMDMRTSNGAQRDGRVRNPIPSKLKGKTDEKKGNFNVMHMDISNRTESQARYDAAKRSSESTALQAKLAETDHYVSHHRRANYTRPKPPRASTAHPPSVTTPEDAVAPVAAPPPPPPPPPAPAVGHHFSSEETKAEQARLLTLLRTLPHANIVDQLCKALAFFGGIPDAPPPQDGKFPESAEANGSGSLFVGWIAEIFPDLERPPRPVITLSAPPKRPRGRPKGSKATKARRDKGLKKGAKGPDGSSSAVPGEGLQNADDDTWVDVDDSVMDADGNEDTVEDRVLSLLSTPPRSQAAGATTAIPTTGSSAGFTSINHGTGEPGSATKRRGRPKGSKNRPKDANSQETPQQGQPAPIVTPASNIPVPTPTIVNTGTPVTDSSSKKKAASARPKGSKSKSKIANDSATQSTAPSQQTAVPQPQTSTSYIPPPTLPLAATRPSAAGPSQSPAVNGGGGKNKRTQLPPQSAAPVPASQPSTPQVKESTIVGAKRKRQSNKNAGTTANTDSNANSTAPGIIAPQSAPSTTPVMNSGSTLPVQADQVDLISAPNSASAPPAKRARKSNAANSKRQNTTSAGADAPSTAASTDYTPTQQTTLSTGAVQSHAPSESLDAHFDPFPGVPNHNDQNHSYASRQQNQQHNTAGSSGQTPLSAPAEGLDAHLERFTTLQNRQQNTQQNNNARQQQSTQIASPTPSQSSKVPQVANLHSQQQQQQQVRTTSNAPNYYPHNQTASYTMQQGSSYAANQRQQQNTSTSSPGTALVSQVTHSPQFASQSNNSPLLNTDNTFRGSPSLGYAPRRTPSASPMDGAYRSAGVSNQPSHFSSARQAPASSHAGVPASFGSFSDPNFLDIPGFDSGGNQNSIGMNNTGASYNLGSGNVQRTGSGSNAASAYANAALTNGAYDSSGLNKGTLNANYRGPARWS